jgi:hypothetical protein
MEELKATFLKVYANLPLGVRDEIVLVLEGEPITWNVAYIEVSTDSSASHQILTELKELEII